MKFIFRNFLKVELSQSHGEEVIYWKTSRKKKNPPVQMKMNGGCRSFFFFKINVEKKTETFLSKPK